MSSPWTVRPEDEQRQRWKREAEALGMGESEWVKAMIEAGSKKFNRGAADEFDPATDTDVSSLREAFEAERRKRKQAEREAERWRARALERSAAWDYLVDNPGAITAEIRDFLADTAALRAKAYLRQFYEEGRVEAEYEDGVTTWRVVATDDDADAIDGEGRGV